MNTGRNSTKLYTALIYLILLMVGLVGCESIGAGGAETESIGETATSIDSPGLAAGEMGLTAHLELPEERLRPDEKINLNFVLRNESDEPVYILNWYTPLEGIAGEIFRVTHNGQPVPYEGILASRTSPSPEAYILLKPGESASATVDLATAFDFSEAGVYTIEFLSPRISHTARTEAEMAKNLDELGPVHIPSKPVTLEIVDQ